MKTYKDYQSRPTKLYTLNIDALKEKAKLNTSGGAVARKKLNILWRDKFKCVQCGGEKHLTIAHLRRPIKKTTGKNRVLTDFTMDNCVTLCENCHIYLDFKAPEKAKKELIKKLEDKNGNQGN